MSGGWFQPRRLQFNETITSRCAFVAPQSPTAPPQMESEGPYRGKVVDFTAASGAGAPTQLMEEKYPSYVTHRMGIFI